MWCGGERESEKERGKTHTKKKKEIWIVCLQSRREHKIVENRLRKWERSWHRQKWTGKKQETRLANKKKSLRSLSRKKTWHDVCELRKREERRRRQSTNELVRRPRAGKKNCLQLWKIYWNESLLHKLEWHETIAREREKVITFYYCHQWTTSANTRVSLYKQSQLCASYSVNSLAHMPNQTRHKKVKYCSTIVVYLNTKSEPIHQFDSSHGLN